MILGCECEDYVLPACLSVLRLAPRAPAERLCEYKTLFYWSVHFFKLRSKGFGEEGLGGFSVVAVVCVCVGGLVLVFRAVKFYTSLSVRAVWVKNVKY